MNDYQKRRFAENIISTLYNTVSDKKIAFLGWAFKKDTNDTRETAAMYVADHLMEDHAKIHPYDPKVTEQQMHEDMNYLNTLPGRKSTSACMWKKILTRPQKMPCHCHPYRMGCI